MKSMQTILTLCAALLLAGQSSHAGERVLLSGSTTELINWPSIAAVRGDILISENSAKLSLASGSSPWRALLRSPEKSFPAGNGSLVIEVTNIMFGGLPGEKGSNDFFVLLGDNPESKQVADFYPLALAEGVSFNFLRKRTGYELLVFPGRSDKVGEQRHELNTVPTAFTLTIDYDSATWTIELKDAFFFESESATLSGSLPRVTFGMDTMAYLGVGILNWGEVAEGTTVGFGGLRVLHLQP